MLGEFKNNFQKCSLVKTQPRVELENYNSEFSMRIYEENNLVIKKFQKISKAFKKLG